MTSGSNEASISDIARVYTDSKADGALRACLDATDYQSVLDNSIANLNNNIVATAQMGAISSEFDWTWTAAKGLVR